jgi:hypothetical protein
MESDAKPVISPTNQSFWKPENFCDILIFWRATPPRNANMIFLKFFQNSFLISGWYPNPEE